MCTFVIKVLSIFLAASSAAPSQRQDDVTVYKSKLGWVYKGLSKPEMLASFGLPNVSGELNRFPPIKGGTLRAYVSWIPAGSSIAERRVAMVRGLDNNGRVAFEFFFAKSLPSDAFPSNAGIFAAGAGLFDSELYDVIKTTRYNRVSKHWQFVLITAPSLSDDYTSFVDAMLGRLDTHSSALGT